MSSFVHTPTGRHVYQLKAWLRMLYLVLGMALAVIGAFFTPALLSSSRITGMPPFFAVILLCAGIYLLALLVRSQLVLDGTRIEVRGAFLERSADQGEIEGFRTISTRNGSYTRLILREGRGAISIPNNFDTDEDYRLWFRSVTDLDQRDRDQILGDIAADAELGATPDDRLKALATAKTWAVFLSIVTGAAAALMLFGPAPLPVVAAAVLVVVPLISIYLVHRTPLLYTVFRPKADPRAEMAYVFIIAGFGLLMHNHNVHFVSQKALLAVAVPIILVYCVGLIPALVRNGARVGLYFAVVLFLGLYGFGLTMVADTITDHMQSTTYNAEVVGKHVSHGRSTTYYLDLAPWGPQNAASNVSVSSRDYYSAIVGDQVCLRLHPGSLHIAWYQVIDCSSRFGPDSQP